MRVPAQVTVATLIKEERCPSTYDIAVCYQVVQNVAVHVPLTRLTDRARTNRYREKYFDNKQWPPVGIFLVDHAILSIWNFFLLRVLLKDRVFQVCLPCRYAAMAWDCWGEDAQAQRRMFDVARKGAGRLRHRCHRRSVDTVERTRLCFEWMCLTGKDATADGRIYSGRERSGERR